MENNIKEKINYCLNCKIKPCSNKGCPLGNNIPDIISNLKEENYKKAYEILSETTVLPGVCGRICPHEKQCQGSCVRGIKSSPVSIGDIEAFVFDNVVNENDNLLTCWDNELRENRYKRGDKKVAVIGAGPAGLTCGAFLAKNGVSVTIYEKYDYLGGLLVHGIPDFRLPKSIVKKTTDEILKLGIDVKYNKELGKNLYLEDLKKEYDAIFLSIGANKSSKMGIEGEELQGVYGGNELLEYNLHPEYHGKTVIVVGGGNVAMDCARTVKRMGANNVIVVYRRDREQMPAEDKEIEEALSENIEFLFKNNIVKIQGNKKVESVELIKTELIKNDGEERLSPVNIENSNYVVNADYVVMAIGSKPQDFVKSLELNLNKWGNIQIDEKYRTSDSKIFAGGDLAGVKGTVAWAAQSGREAARNIVEFLDK